MRVVFKSATFFYGVIMRIVTRPDFDGIVCAVLLFEALDIKHPVIWVEPNHVQKGLVEIQNEDVVANLPYDARCALWFDHHYTNQIDTPFKGAFKISPSAARVIFDYYKDRLKRDYSELVQSADKIDSADLTLDEVLHPENYPYVLLSLTISNEDQPDEPYWNKLVALFREYDIRQVLIDSEVKQRCQSVVTQNDRYVDFVKKHTSINQNISITDLRALDETLSGNRFLVYSLFPDTVANVRIRYADTDKETILVNVGHSIFNPRCNVNVGLMLAQFDGGGHRGAGSARFPASREDEYIPQIIDILLKNENNEI
jgi:oligoribonuclease NrnB/cAMP/cGMP phosphodiesterase (DHH superfamily)